jgi:hypothetical protein
MKKLTVTFITALLSLSCMAPVWRVLTFAWDEGPETNLRYYSLWMREDTNSTWRIVQSVLAPTNSMVFWNFTEPGLNHFRLTVNNTNNVESLPSNEVTHDYPASAPLPTPPANLRKL